MQAADFELAKLVTRARVVMHRQPGLPGLRIDLGQAVDDARVGMRNRKQFGEQGLLRLVPGLLPECLANRERPIALQLLPHFRCNLAVDRNIDLRYPGLLARFDVDVLAGKFNRG